jgi:D-alanyl-lipoteichoic acid acyltransferase DltB (MBOAT superfamily)
MLFNSSIFALFFAGFFPLYLLSRRNVFWRNALLLVFSYLFYGWWDARFLILVAISTSVDYMAALGAAGQAVRSIDRLKATIYLLAVTVICLAFARRADLWLLVPVGVFICLLLGAMLLVDRVPAVRQRRYWLLTSLITNLGILAFFKYFNFFTHSLAGALDLIGVQVQPATLSIILPVGLSFYTFQAISRTIDSYRGEFVPQRSIMNYAAYHAFFPQLVAGPIERAGHLMPQFEAVRPLTWKLFISGASLFLWGLYQKVVIADNIAPLANAVFSDPGAATAGATIVGILAFTFQIYCDFCGYSNMARGIARCLGFDLMANFDLPYFARTPAEFWRRWHISLSRWLRDYLYIALGGNRHGTAAMYRNLMITMLLGGLWHGAAWTFVAWGAFHGAIQVLYRALKIDAALVRVSPASLPGALLHLASWFVTMLLVVVGWVFFRAPSFAIAVEVLRHALGSEGFQWQVFLPLVVYVGPLLAVEILQRFSGIKEALTVGPFLVRYTAALSLLLTLLLFSARGGQQFIYFDF